MHRLFVALTAVAALAGAGPDAGAPDALKARFFDLPAAPVTPAKAFPLRTIDGDARVLPWDNAELRWMCVRVASTQLNLEAAALDEKGEPTATFDRAGVGVIGVDLKPHDTSVDGAALRVWLETRATKSPGAEVPHEAKGVRLQRTESLKIILRCGAPAAEAGASEAAGRLGLGAEIMPLMDPLALRLPSTLAVKAYAGGSGVAGAHIIAKHVPTGRIVECRADGAGIAQFTLDAPGQWRLEFHSLAPAPKGEEPALVLRSATLTFECPAPPPPPAAGGER